MKNICIIAHELIRFSSYPSAYQVYWQVNGSYPIIQLRQLEDELLRRERRSERRREPLGALRPDPA
jgi:hypothetical protein